MWRFAIPGTRAFCRALRLRPFAFDAWDEIVHDADRPAPARYPGLCAEGEAIERFFGVEVERLAASSLGQPRERTRRRPLNGLAINANALFASELGSLLAARSVSAGRSAGGYARNTRFEARE